jgi:hypothetical protein
MLFYESLTGKDAVIMRKKTWLVVVLDECGISIVVAVGKAILSNFASSTIAYLSSLAS